MNSITERVFFTTWRVESLVKGAQKRVEAHRGPFPVVLGQVADREIAAREAFPAVGGQHADAAVRIAQPPRQFVVV